MRNILILELTFYVYSGFKIDLILDPVVLPGASPWNERVCDGAVFVSQLHAVARRRPIGEPAIIGLAQASDDIADEKTVVGVPIAIDEVPIIQVAGIRNSVAN